MIFKNNVLKLVCIAAVAAMVITACQPSGGGANSQRPNNPWVFRSVLDSIPRVVTFALHQDMWVSYSAEHGALYKAWKGRVNFDGPVYTTHHGPQPTSVGDAWVQNRYAQPWVILENGKETAPQKVQYKGHRFTNKGKHAHLMYDLITSSGAVIRVTEQPEYFKDGDNAGLERVFTTENVPNGIEVALKANIGSVAFAEQIKNKGGDFKVNTTYPQKNKGLSALEVDGMLVLKSNGSTRLKTTFVKKPMIDHPKKKDLIKEEPEELDPGYVLIAQNDCKTCHNTYRYTIGPAYMQVAQRYENSEANVKQLTAKVVNGGAGNWGEAAMNAHPNIAEKDIQTMVRYILNLDAEEEAKAKASPAQALAINPLDTNNVNEAQMSSGVLVKFFQNKELPYKLEDFKFSGRKANYEAISGRIQIKAADVKWSEAFFAFTYDGYLKVDDDGDYFFRMQSDDGSKYYINDQLIGDQDGLHGMEGDAVKVNLKKGWYKLRAEFFQGSGGIGLTFDVRVPGNSEYIPVPASMLYHNENTQKRDPSVSPIPWDSRRIPGDGFAVAGVHPSFTLTQARPDLFMPKVGGMDFLSDGRMVVCTWDAAGSVYILENVAQGDPEKIIVKEIGSGLAEPLGLKVVDDEIYILQKQELTKLVDHDGDDVIDEYQTISNAWEVSANFHEFAFGLAYQDGYFYGTLATAIEAGGASSSPQIQDRGKVVKIAKADGATSFLASGLRTPNGIGIGFRGGIFVADNQGDWIPASKIVHVREGAWFGSRSVDPLGTADSVETPPVVWLPQDEIGNSPSQITYFKDGVFKEQMLHGEVTHGGLKRVFVEEVQRQYQGAVFRFTQGIEAGVNRVCWGPDGGLYVGGIGSTGNWGHEGGLYYGLQRLEYQSGQSTFEMKAIRTKKNGFEIELTEPLQNGKGWDIEDYQVKRWWYKPTENYGGPKMDEKELTIKSVTVAQNRRHIFLELDQKDIKEGHVYYFHLVNHPISSIGNELWSAEGWYTLNKIGKREGKVRERPASSMNSITQLEEREGWKLLFNGKDLSGWHIYNSNNAKSAWRVQDGALAFVPTKGKGGDIVTDEEFSNYILELEWKISDCGNSGIFLNVVEDKKYHSTWLTGIEMQVLDNSCHPDANIHKHRAGDLYDLIPCKFETVKPAGQWNKVRIQVKNGQTEFWLNGHKVVEFEMWTDDWNAMIENSKFSKAKMPDAAFGQAKKGRIALQDHGDKVWYRNIRIKPL